MGCFQSKQKYTPCETRNDTFSTQEMLKELNKQYQSTVKRESQSFQNSKILRETSLIHNKEKVKNQEKLVDENEDESYKEKDVTQSVKSNGEIQVKTQPPIEISTKPEPPSRQPPKIQAIEIVKKEPLKKEKKTSLADYADVSLNSNTSCEDTEHENDRNAPNVTTSTDLPKRVRKDSFSLYKTNSITNQQENLKKKVKKKRVGFAMDQVEEIPRELTNDEQNTFESWLQRDIESDSEDDQHEVKKMIQKRKSMAAVKIGRVEMLRRKFEANAMALS